MPFGTKPDGQGGSVDFDAVYDELIAPAVEKWLLAQQQEWSCKSCAAVIHWYQKQCHCGLQLEAWELPA